MSAALTGSAAWRYAANARSFSSIARVVLPQEVRGLAEAVERLGALGLAERLLEAGPCCLPVGGSQRLPALAQERVRVRGRHGDMISARSV